MIRLAAPMQVGIIRMVRGADWNTFIAVATGPILAGIAKVFGPRREPTEQP
jgi:hypothetical protein